MIKILPENMANMIAAGEIIDRPASVVKELIENSIDAKSDTIEIHLKQYGKGEIRIIDNGCGLEYHDALLAFERHATSKIREPADLNNIHTLGFRGEALPSIASVAKVTLITRENGAELGTRLILDGGKLLNVSETGAPVGTSIRVSSLFKNIPARLKFMKSNAVELNHIIQALNNEALAHHQISFTLKHNEKTVLYLPGVKTLSERVQQLYGYEIIDHLLEIDGEAGTFKLHGLIGNITYTRTNRNSQYTYANNRFIRTPILLKAISEGYGHTLPRDRHPVCFLFLTIAADQIDVNVHPAKTEVRFSNQQEIFEKTASFIKNRLATSRNVPKVPMPASPPAANMVLNMEPDMEPDSKPDMEHYIKHDIKPDTQPDMESTSCEVSEPFSTPPSTSSPDYLFQFQRGQNPPPIENYIPAPAKYIPAPAKREKSPSSFQQIIQEEDPEQFFTPGSDLLQINNSFILFESSQGLVIVDQHAAHERVRYEQLQREYRTKTIRGQRLLVPITFKAAGHSAESAKELLSPLRQAGFDLEYFGHDTFVIKAIPLLLAKTDPHDLVQGIFEDLSGLPKNAPQVLFDALIMRLACSSAIKANQRLNKEEMRSLIEQLKKTSMPFRCPHGRPTTIQLSRRLLEKHFLRT